MQARRCLFIIAGNILGLLLLILFLEGAVRIVHEWRPGAHDWLVQDPILGFRLSPSLDGVNSLSIRNPEVEVPKPAGRVRVLVLGDSVAFPRDGMVETIRTVFDGSAGETVEVINAAVPGYTTYQERLLFETRLQPTEPDIVVLQYCLNDNFKFLHSLTRNGKFLISAQAQRALFASNESFLSRVTRFSSLVLEIRLRWLILSSKFKEASAFPWEDRIDFSAAWRDESWNEVESNIAAIKALLSERESKFLVVAVPFEPQLGEEALSKDRSYTLKPQQRLFESCQRLSIPLLDLFPEFVEHRSQRLYTDGIHLTPEGHRIAGEAVALFVQELYPEILGLGSDQREDISSGD